MVRHLPSLVLVEQSWPEPRHRLQSVGAELRAGYENRGLRQLASKNRTATAPPAALPSHPLPPCTPRRADTCCSVYHRHTGLETSVCTSGAHANPAHTEPLTWGKQHHLWEGREGKTMLDVDLTRDVNRKGNEGDQGLGRPEEPLKTREGASRLTLPLQPGHVDMQTQTML